MRRAYRPRQSTLDLRRRIAALPGVESVQIEAPHRGVTVTPARMVVTLTGRDGWGAPIRSTFSMAEARAWLAAEEAQA
jgi:hypothetical protein